MTDAQEEQKLQRTKKEKVYLALILAVAAVIAGMLILYPRIHTNTADSFAFGSAAADTPTEPTIITREVEKIVEVEKAVTVETLQQGLNDMGFLITEEYYFTDLVSFSSIKKFLKTDIALPFTESSYLVSYDGVVNAGVDLAAAQIEKDDDRMRITVHIPEASIQTVEIDLDSFNLREEKAGLGNHISVRDFNSSLLELENHAKQNAIDRGLLEKAGENAEVVISRFIGSLVDTSVYSLDYVTD